MVAGHGVHGTGVIINDGFWTTIEQARTVTELVATGGTVVLSAARSRAGSLVGGGQRRLGATSEWVASSAASIRSRLPSIHYYDRSTPSFTENAWSSAQTKKHPHQGQLVKKITVYLWALEPHRIGKLERHHHHFLVLAWPLIMTTSSTMSLRKAP
jgi:hypothetical protein